jgi:hypothetical protein
MLHKARVIYLVIKLLSYLSDDDYSTSSYSGSNKVNNSKSPFTKDLPTKDLPTENPPIDDLFSNNLPIKNSKGKEEINFKGSSNSDREHNLKL